MAVFSVLCWLSAVEPLDFYRRDSSCGNSGTGSGRTTYHYGGNGSSAGRSVRSGNTVYHYDKSGRLKGRSRL